MRDEARRIAANDVPLATLRTIQSAASGLPLPTHNSQSGFDRPVGGFADGLRGPCFPNARGRLGEGGLFSFHRLSGQGVRGMGWPTRLVRESYGRIKRPQLVI